MIDGAGQADATKACISVYVYSMYPVLHSEDLLEVTSSADGRERKRHVLH